MKVFHHTDNDGFASAALVPTQGEETEYIPINYGTPIRLDNIAPDERIAIVDFSISPKEMLDLMDITKSIVWIDHHKTAIAKYADFPHHIDGIRRDGTAACMLTWEFWHQGSAPTAIKLVGDYDVWRFEYGSQTRFFKLGSEMWDASQKNFWDECIRSPSFLTHVMVCGETIMMWKERQRKIMTKAISYEAWFSDARLLCLVHNLPLAGSDSLGGEDALNKYDMLVGWHFDGTKYRYSLRSKKIDVSEIAKKYGGGGHAGAAGFESKVREI